MREYPLFIPNDHAQLAGVLSVPDSEPRGLVLALMGVGPDEVIGSMMFARAARRFAANGFACIRIDYAGVGDSSGSTPTWSLENITAGTEQARAALNAASGLVGSRRFAVAGICYGGRLALELVKDRRCVGAVCLAPPIIRLGTWTRGRRLMKGWRIVSFIRSNPFLRAVLLRPLRKLLVERKASARVAEAMKEIDHARVLFLFSEILEPHVPR